MQIDHVGWVTFDIDLFESFWCDIFEYRCIHESTGTSEMMKILFGASEATIKRYHKEGTTPDLEIHYFKSHLNNSQCFDRLGINHICLHTGNDTRKDLISTLPSNIETYIYDNPKGWQNIFIRDYEGNWIELRESL